MVDLDKKVVRELIAEALDGLEARIAEEVKRQIAEFMAKNNVTSARGKLPPKEVK